MKRVLMVSKSNVVGNVRKTVVAVDNDGVLEVKGTQAQMECMVTRVDDSEDDDLITNRMLELIHVNCTKQQIAIRALHIRKSFIQRLFDKF